MTTINPKQPILFLLSIAIYYVIVWLLFSLIAWINPLDMNNIAKAFVAIISFLITVYDCCKTNSNK